MIDPTAFEELLPLTVPEVRRLLRMVMSTVLSREHGIAWSQWRRRHQARAKRCHYRRHLDHLRSQVRL